MPSSGRDQHLAPDECLEHVWTDTTLTFTDVGAWVEQHCRLCGQIQLQGPNVPHRGASGQSGSACHRLPARAIDILPAFSAAEP